MKYSNIDISIQNSFAILQFLYSEADNTPKIKELLESSTVEANAAITESISL